MADEIDIAILNAAKHGDKLAFDRIQQHYEDHASRFAYRLVGGSLVVDDIVQNAFLALWLNIERIENISHLRSFLFRVLRNQSYDILRKQGRFDKVGLDAVQPLRLTQQGGQPSPEDALHWSMVFELVEQAMDRLPEQQRQTLIMIYQFGLTYAEVADVMDISIGTVKSRVFHARKQLLRLLPPEIIDGLTN
ncbi:MAG: RNA polymerase sigma factor [Anaerolineaceae bacterium]|nr:RNA polymerase sigma factor [Anaerolineaceae bacterium]